MIKEIVEFMDLEGGKFRDIILENRPVAKGLHIIVDKDSFKIKDSAYNDGSEEFNIFVKKYDLKKKEYYCQVKGRGGKNFTNNCFDSKNQIHSNSPYALFFKLMPLKGVFKADSVEKRFQDFKDRWFPNENYFDKLIDNFYNDNDKNIFERDLDNYKKFLKIEFYKENNFLEKLEQVKKDEYIQIFIDVDLEIIKSYYDSYMKSKVFAKEIFNKSSITKTEHLCPVTNNKTNLGLSGFYSSFGDKKPFTLHLTRDKTYGGHSSLYSYKVVSNLYFFQELLKLKLLPNPLPVFISNKDSIDNEGNKIYFELLKDTTEPIKYKEIIKKVYEKISDNSGNINDLNFYLIFWSLQNGLTIYDIDYIDAFEYKIKDFEVKNIFELKDCYSDKIENIFDLEWRFFSKFFYAIKDGNEKIGWLSEKYFVDKLVDKTDKKFKNKYGSIPAMVATKFYQYNKTIFDYIYKGKLEVINGNMFDDICISIIREQIKLNDDWDKTYKIKEKLALYLSLHKNFHKGEDLATQVIELRETVSELIENEENHIESDEEFAFASGQLIWYILSKNKSSSKTHSLLDIFISKNRVDDFKIVISQQIQKYSYAFKFFDNNEDWFGKLVSEVMGYKLEHQTIKSLIPIIMAGYFSKNVLEDKISKKAKENKNNTGDEDGK